MIEGIDIFSGTGVVDWAQAKASGIRFAYIKATQGSDYVNPTWVQNAKAAWAQGLYVGLYHFYRHDVDPAAQAAHFLSTIGTVKDGDLPPCLDVEGPADGAGPIDYPIAEVMPRLKVFTDAVLKATGRAVLIYTYYDFWRYGLNNPAEFSTTNPLWMARYNSPGMAALPNPLPLPGGWARCALWQYDDHGQVPGVKGEVDRNRFMGSEADLKQFAHAAPPEPGQSSRYFAETGHTVAHGFLDLWQYGIDGLPISEEEADTVDPALTVQYFQNSRMEYKPDDSGYPRRGALGVLYFKLLGRA